MKVCGSLKHWLGSELEGSFTVARLQALAEYQKRTPWWWVALVTLGSPFLSIGIVIAMNYFPIQSPNQGVQANWMVFVRGFVQALIGISCLGLQRNFFFDGGHVALPKVAALRLFVAFSVAGMMWLLSRYVAFPMPFCTLVAILPVALLVIPLLPIYLRLQQRKHANENSRVCAVVPIGPGNPNDNERDGTKKPPRLSWTTSFSFITTLRQRKRVAYQQIKLTQKMTGFNIFLLMFFPLLQVAYSKLPSNYPLLQLVAFGCLPLVKLGLVHWAKTISRQDSHHDFAPESAVFTAEFFTSLFSSVFLGMGSSRLTNTIFILVIDLVQIMVPMVQLTRKAKLLALQRQALSLSSWQSLAEHDDQASDLLTQTIDFVRVHHDLVSTQANIVMDLSNRPGFYKRHPLIQRWCLRQVADLQPALPAAHDLMWTKKKSPKNAAMSNDSRHVQTVTKGKMTNSDVTTQLKVLKSTLGLVYAVEHLVLVEYVESFIPYSYALYVFMTFHSPNREFFLVIRDLDDQSVKRGMRSMMVYGLMEGSTLLLLAWLLHRQFRINVFYHLAFVLETHFRNIQGKLTFFLVVLLDFRLVHYGVDFTFQFDWLKNPRPN